MKMILKTAIRGYMLLLSPILGGACRFHPTCSRYALECVTKYGSAKGMWMALCRIVRCNPFSRGGYDPVP